VNIIPERAACEFSVRARDVAERARVQAVVERCARAAAMASGVAIEVHPRPGYKDMRNNMTLARVFGDHLAATGRRAEEADAEAGAGSTDMGDVSHVIPSIHPYLAIVGEGRRCATSTGSPLPRPATAVVRRRSRPRGRWPRRRSSS
jgi:metal-dependent amidase/aminoacylase/carboxypeptidase family protein